MTFTVNPLAIGGEQGYRGLNPNFNPTKTLRFVSPWQTITAAGTLSFEHNLGDYPTRSWCELLCTTANGGYSAGDIVPVPPHVYATSVADNYGIGLHYASATTVDAKIGANANSILLTRADTGSGIAITNTSWKIRIVSERVVIGDVPDILRVGMVPLITKVAANGDSEMDFVIADYWNDYDTFVLEYYDWQNVTDAVQPALRFSEDGSTFITSASYFTNYSGVAGGSASAAQSGANTSGWIVTDTGTVSGEKQDGRLIIKDPQVDKPRNIEAATVGINSTPSIYSYQMGIGLSSTAYVIHTLRLFPVTGNLKSLNATLYGVRKPA